MNWDDKRHFQCLEEMILHCGAGYLALVSGGSVSTGLWSSKAVIRSLPAESGGLDSGGSVSVSFGSDNVSQPTSWLYAGPRVMVSVEGASSWLW